MEIFPIFKKGEKYNATNDTLISLISNFGILLIKVIHIRLNISIIKCKTISKTLFGFTKNKSTNDGLQLLANPIINYMNQNEPKIPTFLDPAFDTGNHKILFYRFSLYCIRGKISKLVI